MRGATLIVLAWNQWALTRRCLDSLFACALDAAEVIVVDNGSTDETAAGLADYADRVRRIALPENLGFVRGMNAGIAAARAGNDVVLLNNDLEFSQHDWLARLRDAAYAEPDHGIVGCRLLGPAPENLVFHVGGFIEAEGLWGQQTESGRQERDVGQYPRVRRVQGIAFALAYIRRDCIDRIGVLDEAFHSYFEDTDYCLRAADAGIACVVAGNVTLAHHQHGSTRDDGGFRERLRRESRATFAARWQQRLLDRVRGNVVWHGHTRMPSAQALLTRRLLGRLEARDLRMSFLPAAAEVPSDDDFRVQLAERRVLHEIPQASLMVTAEPLARAASARRRSALLSAEWDRLPAAWVERCNALDEVIVPDAFQAGVFAASGVRVPIAIAALGVEREYLHTGVPSVRHPRGNMVFLCIAEALQRDAPDIVVRAFREAFTEHDAVELIVHVVPGDDEAAIHDALVPLLATRGGGRVRELFGWDFPAAERGQLYAAADACVSARRGAGWDPVPREALASGLVLLAPAWGSQQDLVKRWGHALPAGTPCEDPAQPGCHWRETAHASLRDALRDVHARRVELVARARAQAAAFAEENHFDASADRLVELLGDGHRLRAPLAKPPRHRPGANRSARSGQVVVLGMHRAGTSSIGGLLALFGAWPGPDPLLLRGDDNPKGHYEHGELHMACLRRLAAAGGDWKQPPREAPAAAVDAFRREVADVLDTLEPRRPWFIKEPRLCLLARELLPMLSDPVFVHVARNPLDVADSLARRDGMAPDLALGLWEHYTRAAFTASAGWSRLLVDYDALLAEPLATAGRLYADLVDAGVHGLVQPPDEAILAWVEPTRERRARAAAARLTPAQQALHDAIRTRAILATDIPARDAD